LGQDMWSRLKRLNRSMGNETAKHLVVIKPIIALAFLIAIATPFLIIFSPFIVAVAIILSSIFITSAFQAAKRRIGNSLFKIYSMLFPNSAKTYTEKYENERGLQLKNNCTDPNKDPDLRINFGPDDPRILMNALLDEPNIENLNMSGCRIGDAGIIQLKRLLENNTIKTLNLSCNSITDIGMKNLCTSLKDTTELETLILSNNKITDAGIESIANLLRTNTKLKILDVSGNEIGDDGALALINVVKEHASISSFNLKNNFKMTLKSNLEFMSLLANKEFTDIYLNAEAITEHVSNTTILNNHNLVNLSISGGFKNKEQAYLGSLIGKNPNLARLSLSSTNIGRGMQLLANDLKINKSLTSLYISFNPMDNIKTQMLANALAENTTLKELTAHSCNISAIGASYFEKAIKNNHTIEDLSLEYNDFNSGLFFRKNKTCQALLQAVKENNLYRKEKDIANKLTLKI